MRVFKKAKNVNNSNFSDTEAAPSPIDLDCMDATLQQHPNLQ